jgi:small subunit ribosomal protein S9
VTKKIIEFIGVGRRKTAIAAVRLRKGKGSIDVNGRSLDKYFPLEEQRNIVLEALAKLDLTSEYDIIIRAKGGGIDAQATASRLGIARALVKQDEDRRGPLKAEGFLTRDPRMKERKKYGLAGARKRFQFSKR